MYEFSYRKAKSVNEAVQALGAAMDGRFLAGGQTLLPTLKQRLAMPSDLIDLAAIADLQKVTTVGAGIAIGAMTTHAAVARSAEVQKIIPALSDLAGGIGDPQVRHRGTLGGSLANNDPSADYPAAVLGLNAKIKTNKREISADDYFRGLFETALEPGELILEVQFPKPQRAGYAKFANPASRYALVGVFVAQTDAGLRVAVTGAGAAGVFRHQELEAALARSFTPEAAKSVKTAPDKLNGDIHASAPYRAHLIGVMAARAVEKALS